MPEWASAVVVLFWATSALCSAYVWWPQTVALWRLRRSRDDLNMFRIKDFLLLGAIFLGTFWRCVVWADLTFNDQRIFGTIDYRWPAEMAISAGIAVACAWIAWLYHQTRYSGRGRSG